MSKLTRREKMRVLTYSMDCLLPGLYCWAGDFVLQLGGSKPEYVSEGYPGNIGDAGSRCGLAIVLPGLRIYSTYNGPYDPPES